MATCQPWPCKPYYNAAIVDPVVKCSHIALPQYPDISQHHHRCAGFQGGLDAIHGSDFSYLGTGLKGAADIIQGRQQRLLQLLRCADSMATDFRLQRSSNR